MEEQEHLEKIERQLERSGFFAHNALSAQADRINEVENFLFGLIDLLLQNRLIEKEELEAMAKRVRDEITQRKEHMHAGIAMRIDPPQETAPQVEVEVNCAERFHVCQGVCCKMNFALSVEEIESGKIKWDLGQPYFVRQEKNGYCSHLDLQGKCCSIYQDRPKVCRKYSCAGDKRIWVDFDKMILNQKWIEENLVEAKIKFQEVSMIPEEKVGYKSKIE